MATPGLFTSQAMAKGLKEKTVNILLQQDYDCEEALITMETDDIVAMGITRGQAGLIKVWIQEIKSRSNESAPDTEATPPGSTLNIPPLEEGACDVSEDETQEHSADIGEPRQPADGQEEPFTGIEMDHFSVPSDVDLGQEIDEAVEVDLGHCVDNLHITDQFRKEICEHVQAQGVLGLDRLLGDKLVAFMACAVNLAVIGRSGTGKSSLINSLRNLRSRDHGAAKVGATETTLTVHPYVHPAVNKIILWDVPGVNTPNFPRDTYLEDVEFEKYDAFIIVCTDRVTEDDLWLASEAHHSERPFYFVRTKIDIDVVNNERDSDETEKDLLSHMRGKIEDELAKASLPKDQVFLVSSVLNDQTKWDFSRLTELLTTQTPPKNRTAMVLAMVSCSKEIIAMKKKELDERIETVALAASTSEERYDKVVVKEIKLYTERFGITDIDLQKWQVDVEKLEPELQKIKRALDGMLIRLSIERAAAEFLLGGVGLLLEYFGISTIYKRWVHQILQKCEDAKHEATQKTSELTRQAARQTLYVALESCTKLALGVLEARQFMKFTEAKHAMDVSSHSTEDQSVPASPTEVEERDLCENA